MAKITLLDAIVFAAEKHSTQRRKDAAKTPYINHPLKVAFLLESVGCGEDVLIAAVLHDIIEDTECDEIALALFAGTSTMLTVLEVSHNKALSKKDRFEKLITSMKNGMSQNAFLIKLADRTQNLQDLADLTNLPDGFDLEKVYRKAEEGQAMLQALGQRTDCNHGQFKLIAKLLKRAVDQILDQSK